MIPTFKNTHEALAFGKLHKGDTRLVLQINRERALLHKEIEECKNNEEWDKALYLASGQNQFLREAREEILS